MGKFAPSEDNSLYSSYCHIVDVRTYEIAYLADGLINSPVNLSLLIYASTTG